MIYKILLLFVKKVTISKSTRCIKQIRIRITNKSLKFSHAIRTNSTIYFLSVQSEFLKKYSEVSFDVFVVGQANRGKQYDVAKHECQ